MSGVYYERKILLGVAMTLLMAASTLLSTEATSTAASGLSEWSRAMESVAETCPPEKTNLLIALHAQLAADRHMELEATTWKHNLKTNSQQAKVYGIHMQAIQTDLLMAVPNVRSQVYLLAQAATVQADFLKERAIENRHAAQVSETLVQQRYAAAVGALGSTLDILAGKSNQDVAVVVLQEGSPEAQECQRSVKHALELVDEDKWSIATNALEQQIVADIMMAAKARRSKYQQEWHAQLGSSVKLATAQARDGDEAAARLMLTDREGQVSRATRGAMAQRAREQLKLDLSYREFQATMERLQRSMQGHMVEMHGVLGGSLRQQAVLLVSSPRHVAVGGDSAAQISSDETPARIIASNGIGDKSSSESIETSVFEEERKNEENIRGSVTASKETNKVETASTDTYVEGTGMVRQMMKWAASSAFISESAYVTSLIARAETIITQASTANTQSSNVVYLGLVLAEIKSAVPLWEAAERDHIYLTMRAFDQWEVITETQMYTSETNTALMYVRVRAGTEMLEACIENTVTSGILHSLCQSLWRKPLAALVRVLLWVGSVHGQVLLPLTSGVLLGVLTSNWSASWSAVLRAGLVGVLIVSMHAVSLAMFRCAGWVPGCVSSMVSAFFIMLVVRSCLSTPTTDKCAVAPEEDVKSVITPVKPIGVNGKKNNPAFVAAA